MTVNASTHIIHMLPRHTHTLKNIKLQYTYTPVHSSTLSTRSAQCTRHFCPQELHRASLHLSATNNTSITSPMLKFTKIFAVGFELFCADGQTDRQRNGGDAGNGSFSQLRETRLRTKSVQWASRLSIEPTTFRTARDREGVQRAGS